ncbi:MAG: GNAT family N-acetyltransferase, partial [Arthrobacter sp.]|nr:GNAT family N-acetyltransferase [Arthrobacter sp.]
RFILWRDTEYARLRVYFVRLEGRVVARAWIHLPLKDNLDTAWLSVGVHPDFEGRGLGRALADHLEAVALSEGRTVVQMGTEHPTGTPDDDGERLLPPTGSGSVRAASRLRARAGGADECARGVRRVPPCRPRAAGGGGRPGRGVVRAGHVVRRDPGRVRGGSRQALHEHVDGDPARRPGTRRGGLRRRPGA